jgi:hypothetical protein
VDELTAIQASNRASCTDAEPCPAADCPLPVRELIPVCEAGRCAAISVPYGGEVVDGFFVTRDAPPPATCETASDCIGGTIPDRTGCCQDPRQVVPHSRAYRDWVTRMREVHCEGVTCPPPPAPARPDDCLFEMQCVDALCANGCDAP